MTTSGNSIAPATPRVRRGSIDLMRGVVMALMALDHTRDFFGDGTISATDLSRTTVALFATRWITHFCAPVFVFLAGVAAHLSAANGKTRPQLARFLASRGVWLVILEVTVVRFAWVFDLTYRYVILQVIWAIGCSMIALSVLIFLPRRVIAIVAVTLIAAHNAFDHFDLHGRAHALWTVLHEQRRIDATRGLRVVVVYPLVPWIAVMAAGYALGPVFQRDARSQRRTLVQIGAAAILAFVVLRASNLYGDPHAWAPQRNTVFTLLSFLNCTKYPPSLLYLSMTLGPALCLLGLWSAGTPRWLEPLRVFGRVPLFYYVLHLYLIHAASVLARHLSGTQHGDTGPWSTPGYSLPLVYAVWLAVVIVLYIPCRWFAGVKQRRHDAWLSYL